MTNLLRGLELELALVASSDRYPLVDRCVSGVHRLCVEQRLHMRVLEGFRVELKTVVGNMREARE